MTDQPPRRILHRLGTTLVVAGMATGSLGQRGHQATGDFMLDRSVTIVVSSDEPQPVPAAGELRLWDRRDGRTLKTGKGKPMGKKPVLGMVSALCVGLALTVGLLRIPEEERPPATLAKANTLYRELKEIEGLEETGLARLARDSVLVEEHHRMLPPPRRKGQDPIDVPLLIALARIEEADTATAAWTAMSRAERAAALGDAQALDRLLALAVAA